MRRLSISLAPVLLAAAALAPPALGAGGPVSALSSPSGVLSLDGDARYLSVWTRAGSTVIKQKTASGEVAGANFLRGGFGVPAVAYDLSASGLSADARTLVLTRMDTSYPRRRSTFAVLDAKRLRLLDTIRLRGDFGFDALSPDGRWLFLVHYLSPARDATRYRVRVYDLERGRLLPKPIVDPRETPEAMFGTPLTRSTSPDGRWAYTLYAGKEHPFIHALDTQDRRALCIDLHFLAGLPNIFRLRLDVSPGAGRITVRDKGDPVALVDTSSWKASRPPARTAAEPSEAGGGVPDVLIVAAGLLAAGAALLLGRRAVEKRRRRARERIDVELGAVEAALDQESLEEGDREPAEVLGVEPRA